MASGGTPSYKLLVLVVGLAATACWTAANPTGSGGPDQSVVNYEKAFRKIGKYLTQSVGSQECEPNMEEARRWLGKLSSNRISALLFDRELISGLELLTSLDGIRNRCDARGRDILRLNDMAAGYAMRRQKSVNESQRRVRIIVRWYHHEHARECRSQWPQLLSQKLSKLGAQADGAKTLLEMTAQNERSRRETPLLGSIASIYEDPNAIGRTEILRGILFSWGATWLVVFDTLKRLASQDPDFKCLSKEANCSEGKIKQLFNRYLLNSCQQYENEVGKQVVEPYLYDSKSVSLFKDPGFMELFEAQTTWRLCHILIETSDHALKGVQQLVAQSELRPKR